jgi:hypothetical protein
MTNKLFEPEFHCANFVVKKLEETFHINRSDAEQILSEFNNVQAKPHYNGSGWMDFQLQLTALLSLGNFPVDVDNATGNMKISFQE